jgi:ABC-2 type transport system permease protein
MKKVFAIALKDLKLLSRDGGSLFRVLVFPFLIAFLFGSIFGGGGGGGAGTVSLLLVDEDGSEFSAEFIERLGDSDAVNVTVSERSSAQDAVRRGNAAAYLVLPMGFGEAQFFDPPTFEIGVDPSRQAEVGILTGVINQVWFEGVSEAFGDPKQLRDLSDDPDVPASLRDNFAELALDLDTLDTGEAAGSNGLQAPTIETVDVALDTSGTPGSSYAITFPQGVIWAFVGIVMSFAGGLVRERNGGTLRRLQSSPITGSQILAGKATSALLASLTVAWLLILFAQFVLGVQIHSYGLLMLAVVCSAVAFTGIMILVSTLGKSENATEGIGWSLLLLLAVFGGGMVPVFLMPGWMLAVGNITPVKWSIMALEGSIWRAYSLSEMVVPCAILLAVGAVCYGLGTARLRLNR